MTPARKRASARTLALLMAAILVVAGTPVVVAQDQTDGSSDAFAWPIQQWLMHHERPPVGTERKGSKQRTGPKAKVIRSGPRSSGAVALTFDDGYNAEACAHITATLRATGTTGTFFINGNWLRSDPNRWRRILRGMEVANHTRSHHNLTHVPHRVVRKQIRENEDVHERVLGRPMLKVLRPPYGAYSDRIRRIARELGYKHIMLWSVDTHDWKRSSSPRKIVRRATGAPPGSVILMHCARGATAKALPSIIRHYKRRGIKLAGLSQVLGL